jgi:hypothetical protein
MLTCLAAYPNRFGVRCEDLEYGFQSLKKKTMEDCNTFCRPQQYRLKLRATLSAVLLIILARSAYAQDSNIFIYPTKNQSQTQQDKDRYECHLWAVKQTGFDPSMPQTVAPNGARPEQYRSSQPHVLKGAGRGAALGAVGGAITGNAGKGAAAGAAMGGLAGGFRRLDERRQQQVAPVPVQSNQSNQRPAYNRAIAACLEGRGYTVK